MAAPVGHAAERLRGGVAPDRVEGDVDAAPVGGLEHRDDEVGGEVIDRDVGAERRGEVRLGG